MWCTKSQKRIINSSNFKIIRLSYLCCSTSLLSCAFSINPRPRGDSHSHGVLLPSSALVLRYHELSHCTASSQPSLLGQPSTASSSSPRGASSSWSCSFPLQAALDFKTRCHLLGLWSSSPKAPAAGEVPPSLKRMLVLLSVSRGWW